MTPRNFYSHFFCVMVYRSQWEEVRSVIRARAREKRVNKFCQLSYIPWSTHSFLNLRSMKNKIQTFHDSHFTKNTIFTEKTIEFLQNISSVEFRVEMVPMRQASIKTRSKARKSIWHYLKQNLNCTWNHLAASGIICPRSFIISKYFKMQKILRVDITLEYR